MVSCDVLKALGESFVAELLLKRTRPRASGRMMGHWSDEVSDSFLHFRPVKTLPTPRERGAGYTLCLQGALLNFLRFLLTLPWMFFGVLYGC